MAGGKSIFEQFERLPKEEQQRKLQSLAPEELDQFENDYNAYQLQSGANRYKRVARGGVSDSYNDVSNKVSNSIGSTPVTGARKPSNSQILQSTGKEVAGTAAKEVAKEGIKEAILGGSSSSLPIPSQVGNFFAGNSANGVASTVGANGQAATVLADGSVVSATPGAGIGSMIGPAAGIATAGINAYDALKNIKKGSRGGKGAVEGVGTLAGTTIGTIFGGAAGAGIGSVIGRTAGRGLASIGQSLGLVGQKSGRDLINDRIQALQDKGVEIPQELLDEYNTYGLSQDELVKRAEESGGNATFARTRDEKDLTPEDTWGGLMWQEVKGNDYLKATTENQRREMNQRALDEGLIDESRGALNFKDPNRASQIFDEVMADTPAVMPGETKDGEPYSLQTPSARKDGETQDKRRPKPKLNDVPVPQPQPAPTPEIRTPKDYAQAYMDVYNANSQLSGVNPYLRRY
jgi:hypothetical protein